MEIIKLLLENVTGLGILVGAIVVGIVALRVTRKGAGPAKMNIGGNTIEVGEDAQRLVALQAEQVSRHSDIEGQTHGDLDRDTRPYKSQFKLLFQGLVHDPYLARAIAAETRDLLRDRVRDNNFLNRFQPANAPGYRSSLVDEILSLYDDETETLAVREEPIKVRPGVEELVTRWLYDVAARCAQDCEDKVSMYEQFAHRFEQAGAPLQTKFCQQKIEKKQADLSVFKARIWG